MLRRRKRKANSPLTTAIRYILSGAVLALALLAGLPRVSVGAEGTGLPLPRFVSLRGSEANLRAGPGVQYPVEWVYSRQELPVEIVAEYYTWRKVRDWQGSQGWVHQSVLSSARTIIVSGGLRTLRRQPDAKSAPIARLEANVVGKLRECPDGSSWCKIEVDGFAGWLRKVEFWGVYPTEVTR